MHKANPPGFLSWFKESTALHEDENISMGYDAEKDLAQLVLANAKMEDAGKYTVVAKNEAGQIFSSANLLVDCKFLSLACYIIHFNWS